MHLKDFGISKLEKNSKTVLRVEISTDEQGEVVQQTLLVIRGNKDGPILLLTGGVHGDEFEGPQTIVNLFHEIEPENLSGSLIGLVIANEPAYQHANRCNPIDGKNLARVFPGDPKGSVTEQIAYWMGEILIGKADYYIDLHSSGSDSEMPQMCGYIKSDSTGHHLTSQDMAEAFRANVTWAHPNFSSGRTLSYAYDHVIPAIYSECPSTRCVSINDLEVYSRGALNVMKLIGMTQGKLEGSPSKYYLSGNGDTDQCVSATTDGFFQPDKNLLDLVKKGESLGTIKSLSGELLEEIFSPIQGYVGMRRMLPSTHVGDSLFMIVDGFRS
mgnify:FL=1